MAVLIYVSLAAFVFGLLLAVRAMLNGVERPARPPAAGRASTAGPRFSLNGPTVAGFSTVFGVTGYLLARYASFGVVTDTVIAVVAGAVGAATVLTLVAAWAIPAAKAEVVDERYVLQGAFARVIAISDKGTSGMVTYEFEGSTHTSRATALDGARLEVGAEVVIERIENGVAFVEPWARVEARL